MTRNYYPAFSVPPFCLRPLDSRSTYSRFPFLTTTLNSRVMISIRGIKSQGKTPTEPTWLIDQIPDLEGKVVIVTGGSSGITHASPRIFAVHQSRLEGVGREICKQLLLKNAKVYMADESKVNATVAIAEIAIENDGKYALLHHLDLADLNAVNQSAEAFLKYVDHRLAYPPC
jgi:hypothetical protein